MRKIGIFLQSLPLYVISIALFLFSSCRDIRKIDTDILNALKENLKESNATINNSTAANMKTLYDKSVDFCTKERATIWLPKAELVIDNSKKIYDHIENIRSEKDFDNTILETFTIKLNNYKQIVLSADSSIMEEFINNFKFIDHFTSLANNMKGKKLTNNSVSALLTLLQNDVKIIENEITAYCNLKIGCTIFFFDNYSAIIGQNSNYFKPGSKLKINAGIGAYSKSTRPLITINGTKVELGFEGFSSYQMKVPEKSGNYSIPVNIKFMNPITRKEEENKINVDYTVAKPCDQ